jgi:type I restriction enzyme R subunit
MFLDPNKIIDRHRVNLPHWQQGETWIFVTWRLADSLPKAVVEKLAQKRLLWEKQHPLPWSEEEQKEHNRKFTLGFEALLDDAHGECLFSEENNRAIVSSALFHFHGDRFLWLLTMKKGITNPFSLSFFVELTKGVDFGRGAIGGFVDEGFI